MSVYLKCLLTIEQHLLNESLLPQLIANIAIPTQHLHERQPFCFIGGGSALSASREYYCMLFTGAVLYCMTTSLSIVNSFGFSSRSRSVQSFQVQFAGLHLGVQHQQVQHHQQDPADCAQLRRAE